MKKSSTLEIGDISIDTGKDIYLLQVIDVQLAQLWFSGKEFLPGRKMKDFVGNNEKTKIIVKLQKRGSGKPSREPLMSEDERKQLMLHAYRRQEQLKVSVFSYASMMRISQMNHTGRIHFSNCLRLKFSNHKNAYINKVYQRIFELKLKKFG